MGVAPRHTVGLVRSIRRAVRSSSMFIVLAFAALACGGRTGLDVPDGTALTDSSNFDADEGSDARVTCFAGPTTGETDASPGTVGTITCPVGWHCDTYSAV